MQIYNLDISHKGVLPLLQVKQGDVGRKFKVIMTDREADWEIPKGAALSVWYSGASGEGNYSMIGENSAFTVEGNMVTVELIAQMLANSGDGMLCLVMSTAEGANIGTWNIPYHAEKLPGKDSVGAEQYYTAFTEIIDQANEATDRVEQAVADAKELLNLHSKSNVVLSESAVAFGENNTVGLLGFYWTNIDFATNTLTLSTKQGEEVWSKDAAATWAVGDVVSIVNNTKYEYCSKIVSIAGNKVALDSLPFTAIAEVADPSFDDYSVAVYDKPTEGMVDLGKQSAAIGNGNAASNWCATAIGRQNVVQGQYGLAVGRGNTVKAYAGHAEGAYNTIANTALYSHVEGLQSKASGSVAHAEGSNTEAVGAAAHSEGYMTKASGDYSHAQGYKTKAEGQYAHSEGHDTAASGIASHAEGYATEASGMWAHAEGKETKATLTHCHAEGWQTEATGDTSHAEGCQSKSTGAMSHAEGSATTSSGKRSHAEGYLTESFGEASHAEGRETKAMGYASHAEGYATEARADYSHAGGQGTIAKLSHQTVVGKYNADESAYFIVGNGQDDAHRNNAFAVKGNGDIVVGGRIKNVGTPVDATDAANKAFVEAYFNPLNPFSASSSAASVTAYPTKAGIYRTVGTNIFKNLGVIGEQLYGTLVIFQPSEYQLHIYLDTWGNLYWGRTSGGSVAEPLGWNKALGEVLPSSCYGSTLPAVGTPGKIFFKVVG